MDFNLMTEEDAKALLSSMFDALPEEKKQLAYAAHSTQDVNAIVDSTYTFIMNNLYS